jgi:hypothetical protein
MRAILFIVAIFGSIAGALVLTVLFSQSGAAQQGAVAALAVALAVIPYCLARSYTEIRKIALDKKLPGEIGQAVANALDKRLEKTDQQTTPSQYLLKNLNSETAIYPYGIVIVTSR